MEKYRTAGRLIIFRPCPAARNAGDTDSLHYNSYLHNKLDHSFEGKLLSTGRKLQLTLGLI